MSYYILDKCGNFIAEYRTFKEIEKAYNTPYVSFCECSNYISAIVNNKSSICKKRLSASNVVCVTKDDYINHLKEIIWLLTREDVLVINKEGRVLGAYKTNTEALNSLSMKGINANKSVVNFYMNVSNKDFYGYRFATREHYIEMIKKDPLYYSKEYERPNKLKSPVDMYSFKTGEFIKSFASQTDAAKYMGCSRQLISQAIKNGSPILKTDYCFVLAEKEEGENNG